LVDANSRLDYRAIDRVRGSSSSLSGRLQPHIRDELVWDKAVFLQKLAHLADGRADLIAFGKLHCESGLGDTTVPRRAADASQSGNPVWRLGAGLHGLSDTARGFATCLLSRLGKGLGVIITRYA